MNTFERGLRDELMAATRRRPRRRVGAAVVGGVVAATAITIAMVTFEPESASADVEITHEDGRVLVRLTDRENTPEAIEAATDNEGFDIEVEGAPSGPSNVGRFIGSSGSEADLLDVQTLEQDGVTFMAFSVPEDWDGELTLYLGQPAGDGEGYLTFSDAYGPGEPLECSGTLGETLRALEPYIEEYDVTVQAFEGGTPTEPLPLRQVLDSGGGDAIVTGAVAVSPTAIIVDTGRTPSAFEDPAC